MDKMLRQCLEFSSLIDDFAAVLGRKPMFQSFNYILSNEKQNAQKRLFSTEKPRLIDNW